MHLGAADQNRDFPLRQALRPKLEDLRYGRVRQRCVDVRFSPRQALRTLPGPVGVSAREALRTLAGVVRVSAREALRVLSGAVGVSARHALQVLSCSVGVSARGAATFYPILDVVCRGASLEVLWIAAPRIVTAVPYYDFRTRHRAVSLAAQAEGEGQPVSLYLLPAEANAAVAPAVYASAPKQAPSFGWFGRDAFERESDAIVFVHSAILALVGLEVNLLFFFRGQVDFFLSLVQRELI